VTKPAGPQGAPKWLAGARRWWRRLRFPLGLALVALGVWVVSDKSSELSGATAALAHLRWGWIGVAAVAEFLSYVAYAQIQRELLAAGGVATPRLRVTALTFAGNTIQTALPAGPVLAAGFSFRQYRLMGADELLAGWVVVGTAVTAFLAISVLAGVGLAAAASAGSFFDLVTAIVGVIAVAVALALVWVYRVKLRRPAIAAIRLVQRLVHRPSGAAEEVVDRFLVHLAAVVPTGGQWARAWLAGVCNWVADCSCLAIAYAAIGVTPPWQGLLLAYCAAQLATNLPITPGGLGVVEGSLTVALTQFGGGQATTVAAVILYRLISFWSPIPIGALSYVGLRLSQRGPKEASA
jgi:uncharacterized protein (TIRG00374 family)